MPIPSMGVGASAVAYTGIVHRMALATAALYAVSDPGVAEGSAVPATSMKMRESDWRDHENAINTVQGRWINSYARRLAVGTGLAWEDDVTICGLFGAGMAALFRSEGPTDTLTMMLFTHASGSSPRRYCRTQTTRSGTASSALSWQRGGTARPCCLCGPSKLPVGLKAMCTRCLSCGEAGGAWVRGTCILQTPTGWTV